MCRSTVDLRLLRLGEEKRNIETTGQKCNDQPITIGGHEENTKITILTLMSHSRYKKYMQTRRNVIKRHELTHVITTTVSVRHIEI